MIFLLQFHGARRALQPRAQFLDAKGLGYVVHGAQPRGRYRRIDRSVLRQHDHRQIRVGVAHALQQIQPAGSLQPQVRQHDIHRGVLQYFQGLLCASYREGFHARLPGNLDASLPDRRLIIDDEDIHRGGLAEDCCFFETASMNILIVDDEPSIRETCVEVARQAGMKAFAVASAEEALEVLENSAVDIVLTDLRLQRTSGLDLLKRVRDTNPNLPVIVLTQYGTIDSAVAATRLGAVDYVTKPFRIEELRSRLERAARAAELQQENHLLREQLRTRPGFGGLIGLSERMQRVYKIIQRVSLHEYPVLILGESGTGKELVAKSVHFSGPRKERPFVPVDCSSLVPTLIESELFGYVKGAFTGALHGKQGLLEAANGGTLFLDEIGDMPVDLQAKLLRALQEREVKPVGSTERRHIDVRII